MAVGKLRGLNTQQIANALGIAASSAAGLFAFVNGGGDIKRLHAGHASREGLQAALLAEQGVEGPPGVIESRDGFMQAFAFGRIDKARPITLPPDAEFGITDCYIKPYACCRHIQPAVEAMFGLLNDENIKTEDIRTVDVETYKIAAEHAHVPWDNFANAQLSFPYLMGLAARYRGVKFEHFDEQTRNDPAFGEFARKLTITAPTEIDAALSEAAAGARDGHDRARQIHPSGRRGLGLAPRSARRRRIDRKIPRPGRAGVRRQAGRRAGRTAVERRPGQKRLAADRGDGLGGALNMKHEQRLIGRAFRTFPSEWRQS